MTGSRYLLEVAGKRVLVDCGLFQGTKELRLRNWEPFGVDPATLDLAGDGLLNVAISQGAVSRKGLSASVPSGDRASSQASPARPA